MPLSVEKLTFFPVKSLRGISQDSARLTRTGLQWDRNWLVLDGRGRFMSQRNAPGMAQVVTAISDTELLLRHERTGGCAVPLTARDGERMVTRVWDDRCEVVDQGDEVAAWLAETLGEKHAPRLVRMAPDFERDQGHPERYGAEGTVRFADSAPYLVTNTASLAVLNETLEARRRDPVTVDRFRANIVVSGWPAFREHRDAALEGPGYRLGLRYPRERCVVTTLDQSTGRRDENGEPFETLRELNPMPDNPRGPAFGQLAVLEMGAGQRICVGDALDRVG